MNTTILQSKKYTFYRPQIDNLKMLRPIYVTLDQYDDEVQIVSTELGLIESGEDEIIALRNFIEFFVEDANNYLTIDDRSLTTKALELKKVYSNIVEIIA